MGRKKKRERKGRCLKLKKEEASIAWHEGKNIGERKGEGKKRRRSKGGEKSSFEKERFEAKKKEGGGNDAESTAEKGALQKAGEGGGFFHPFFHIKKEKGRKTPLSSLENLLSPRGRVFIASTDWRGGGNNYDWGERG